MKYWEMIADRLSAQGWSLGWVRYQAPDFEGWKIDAHKEEQRHQILADDISAGFVELEASVKQ